MKKNKFKKVIITFILTLTFFVSQAQLPRPGYYFKDSLLYSSDNKLRTSFQSYYLTFIGEYQLSLKTMDKVYESHKPEKLSFADSIEFKSKYKAVDATDYIIEKAKGKKIVMMNEAHNMPQLRAYFITILQKLYDEGFRYLGMEALQNDTLLNKRGYPILNKENYDGWFLYEPNMGNIIREALKIGFKVFPYEMDDKESVVPYNREYAGWVDGSTMLEREIRQAFNIMKIFKADTAAKVVIWAGYGHISRGWNDHGMATYVWRFLGAGYKYRPLSISETNMIEKSDTSMEDRLYLLANVDKPTVFVDEKNNSFKNYLNDSSNSIDISVFHPHAKYIDGRPDWLYKLDRIPYYIDSKKHKVQYPIIAKAYIKGEDIEEAVPFDVIQINDKKEKKPLLLKKGNYIIELMGMTQSEHIEIEVK